ncbi:MAG: hypothetical protein K4304_04145 [Propionicimonas sp.]
MMRAFVRRVFGLFLAAAILVAGWNQPSVARADELAAVKVLALGDSYTAGLGGGDYYDQEGCSRSPHSWASQWVGMLRSRSTVPVEFENYACSGATMANFYMGQDGDAGSKHVRQLDHVDETYDIVLLTIGGNDLGFDDIAKWCLLGGALPMKCKSAYSKASSFVWNGGTSKYFNDNGLEYTWAQAVKNTLVDVGSKMHAGAKIVYLGYPSLARETELGFNDHYCADISCEVNAGGLMSSAKHLAVLQREAVDQANAELAEVTGGLGARVVPMLDVVNVISPNLPLIGADAAADSELWDPVFEKCLLPAGPLASIVHGGVRDACGR